MAASILVMHVAHLCYEFNRRSRACSLSSVLRTPSSVVRTAVAAAIAAVRGPLVDERKCALAYRSGIWQKGGCLLAVLGLRGWHLLACKTLAACC